MKKQLLIALLFISSLGFAQEHSFKIQFKNTENTIRMICLDNCEWFEIEFKTSDFNTPKFISNHGESDDSTNAQYLFSLEKIDDEKFVLKGLQNTEWKEYEFKTKGFWANFLLTDKGLKNL